MEGTILTLENTENVAEEIREVILNAGVKVIKGNRVIVNNTIIEANQIATSENGILIKGVGSQSIKVPIGTIIYIYFNKVTFYAFEATFVFERLD